MCGSQNDPPIIPHGFDVVWHWEEDTVWWPRLAKCEWILVWALPWLVNAHLLHMFNVEQDENDAVCLGVPITQIPKRHSRPLLAGWPQLPQQPASGIPGSAYRGGSALAKCYRSSWARYSRRSLNKHRMKAERHSGDGRWLSSAPHLRGSQTLRLTPSKQLIATKGLNTQKLHEQNGVAFGMGLKYVFFVQRIRANTFPDMREIVSK